MKYVFVLALLHLCVTARSDTNLNNEIITRLNYLKEKVTSMSNGTVKVPTVRTLKNPKCLGLIKKELENLLDKVDVQNEDKHYIAELKGNLNALGNHIQNECPMKTEQEPKNALQLYRIFFRRLNTRA